MSAKASGKIQELPRKSMGAAFEAFGGDGGPGSDSAENQKFKEAIVTNFGDEDIVFDEFDSDRLASYLVLKGKRIDSSDETHVEDVRKMFAKVHGVRSNFSEGYQAFVLGDHALRQLAVSSPRFNGMIEEIGKKILDSGVLEPTPKYDLANVIGYFEKEEVSPHNFLGLIKAELGKIIGTPVIDPALVPKNSKVKLDDEDFLREINCFSDDCGDFWSLNPEEDWTDKESNRFLADLFDVTKPYGSFECENMHSLDRINDGSFLFNTPPFELYRCYDPHKARMRYISIGQIYDKLLYAIALGNGLAKYKGVAFAYDHNAIVAGLLRNNIFSPDIENELREKLCSPEVVAAVKKAVTEERGIGFDSYLELCKVMQKPKFIKYIAQQYDVSPENVSVDKNKIIIRDFDDENEHGVVEERGGIIFKHIDTKPGEYVMEVGISDIIEFENVALPELRKSTEDAIDLPDLSNPDDLKAWKYAAANLLSLVGKKPEPSDSAAPKPKSKPKPPQSKPAKPSSNSKIQEFKRKIRNLKVLKLGELQEEDGQEFWNVSDIKLVKFFETRNFNEQGWKALSFEVNTDGKSGRLRLEVKSPDDLVEEAKVFSGFTSTYALWEKDGYKKWKKTEEEKLAKAKAVSAPPTRAISDVASTSSTTRGRKGSDKVEEEAVAAAAPKIAEKKPTKEELDRIKRAEKALAKKVRREERMEEAKKIADAEAAKQAEIERVAKEAEAKTIEEAEAKRIADEAEARRLEAEQAIENSKQKINSFVKKWIKEGIAPVREEMAKRAEDRRIVEEAEAARLVEIERVNYLKREKEEFCAEIPQIFQYVQDNNHIERKKILTNLFKEFPPFNNLVAYMSHDLRDGDDLLISGDLAFHDFPRKLNFEMVIDDARFDEVAKNALDKTMFPQALCDLVQIDSKKGGIKIKFGDLPIEIVVKKKSVYEIECDNWSSELDARCFAYEFLDGVPSFVEDYKPNYYQVSDSDPSKFYINSGQNNFYLNYIYSNVLLRNAPLADWELNCAIMPFEYSVYQQGGLTGMLENADKFKKENKVGEHFPGEEIIFDYNVALVFEKWFKTT